MNKFVPYNRELLKNSRELRHNLTEAERKIWLKILCRRQMRGHKFLRQKPLQQFIVDFYCPSLLLAIEIDGDTHDLNKQYDEQRTKLLNAIGVKLVRYTNSDVLHNLDGVYTDLEETVKEREYLFKEKPKFK